MRPNSIECNTDTLKTWLTKQEYDNIKQNGKTYLKVFKDVIRTMKINKAVYELYHFFETHLPGFFNHFYNMTTACDVIDTTKETVDPQLYQRYLIAAKTLIVPTKVNLAYDVLFDPNDPQYLLLQTQFFGLKAWVGQKEELLYWWFDKETILRLKRFISFILESENYLEAKEDMFEFFGNFEFMPDEYANENNKTTHDLPQTKAEHKQHLHKLADLMAKSVINQAYEKYAKNKEEN